MMNQLHNFSKNDFFVAIRLSLFSGFTVFLMANWIWKFVGYHELGLPSYYLPLLSLLFFGLFFFTKNAVHDFFVTIQYPLLSQIVSTLRIIVPFNSKWVQTAFMLHYFLVEPHFFDYGLDHPLFLGHILLFSATRNFIIIPSLLFRSLVAESKSVQILVNSKKFGHTKQQIRGTAVDALANAAKGKIDPAAGGVIIALAASGFFADLGLKNKTEVPFKLEETASKTNQQLRELDAKREAEKLCEQQRNEGKEKLSRESVECSNTQDIKTTMADESLKQKLEEGAHFSREKIALYDQQTEELQECLEKTIELQEKAAPASFLSRMVTETVDLLGGGFAAGGVSMSQATENAFERLKLASKHSIETRALTRTQETSAEVFPVASILENWMF